MPKHTVKTRPKATAVPSPPLAPESLPARRTDALALVSFVALHAIFWWRALLLRGFLLTSDICYQFEPFKSLLHDSLRAGRLALWSPYLFCGYPVGAEGQTATFYPPSLLFSWLFSGGGAVNWLLVTHLMLAAAGMYLLARTLGLRPFGAWLAALVLSCSGYLFAHAQHVGLICTAAWLPVTILFVERAWRGKLLLNLAFASLAWGLAALAGHPQTLFHITLLMIFWVAWRSLQWQRTARRWPLRRATAVFFVPVLLGAGLAAVQLLLTKDLSASAPHGDRGSLAYVTSFSLLPVHLLGLFAPNWQGSPAFGDYTGQNYYWEYVLYIGLLPLLLAVIGGTSRRGRVFAGLAGAALVLALAQGNPLYQVLRFLPGFADFRAPARFIYIFTFAAALLAGLGWETVCTWPWLRPGRRALVVGCAVAVLAMADLLQFGSASASLTSPAVYQLPNPVAERLRRDRGWYRLAIQPAIAPAANWNPENGWARNPDGWEYPRMFLIADTPQSYHLRTAYGYAGFQDATYEALYNAATSAAGQGQFQLLSLLGVKYLFATSAVPRLERTPIGPLSLYRNPDAFGRAFVIGEVVPAATPDDALRGVVELANADRLRQTAVVTGEVSGIRPERGATAHLTVTETRPEDIAVHAVADRDALLVLNERWDQGWRALLDGRPTQLVRADAVLMGVPLPKGDHVVEFLYQPRGLLVGRPIALVSLLIWLGLLCAGLRPRRTKKEVISRA